jgi:hypothetical protein
VIDLAGIFNDPACDLDEKITYEINLCGAQWTAVLAKAAAIPRLVIARNVRYILVMLDRSINLRV